MKRFVRAKSGGSGAPTSDAAPVPVNPAEGSLSIAPEELEGATLLAAELAAGGRIALAALSSDGTVRSGQTLGYVPPEKQETSALR